MIFRPWAHVTAERLARPRGRLGHLSLDRGEALFLQQAPFSLVEHRIGEHVAHQSEDRNQVVACGFDAGECGVRAAHHGDPGLESIDLVRDLLTGARRSAAHEHAAGHGRIRGPAHESRFRPMPEREGNGYRGAPRALGKQSDLETVVQFEAGGARFDVRRGWIEFLSLDHFLRPGVSGHQRHHVGRFRNLGPRRLFVHRNEDADGSVRGLQVGSCDDAHPLGKNFLDPITMQEEEPPVTHRPPFGEVQGEPLGVLDDLIELGQQGGLGALYLLVRRGRGDHVTGDFRQGGPRIRQRSVFANLRIKQKRAWLPQLVRERTASRREPRFHESLVQAPRWLVTEHVRQDIDRREVIVRPGWNVVHRHHELRVSHAAQSHGALAILRGLGRVRRPQDVPALAHGAWNRPELLDHQLLRPVRLEPAGDHQHGVVRLVVLSVERLQALDRHIFEVRPGADRGVPVVVPLKRRGHGALHQDPERAVLPRLPLVAYHRHF